MPNAGGECRVYTQQYNSRLQPVLGAALSAGQVNAAVALVYQAKAAHAVSQQGEYGGWWCAVS